MKRTFLILVLCLFIFSIASARSLQINVEESEVGAYSEVYIDYEIDLGERETFTYEIGIRNGESFSIFEKTVTTQRETGSLTWNTENYEAGIYEAYIFMEPDIRWPSRKFEILPHFDFEISLEEVEIFVYKEDATKSFQIENTGNVPVFISLAPRGLKSRAELVPMTYDIDVGESRNFLFSVEKPKEHYEAHITIEASWEEESIEKELPIKIYNPIVEIIVENIEISKVDDSQIVTGEIINNGNIHRNVAITYSVDDKKETQNVMIYSNETFEINDSFSSEQKVRYIEISYIDSDGEEATFKESFSIIPSFDIPFLDIETLKDNFNYLILGAIILFAILFLISRKGKLKHKK